MLQSWSSRGDRMWGTDILVDTSNHFRRWASVCNFQILSIESVPSFCRIFLAMTLEPSSKPTSIVLWDKEIRLGIIKQIDYLPSWYLRHGYVIQLVICEGCRRCHLLMTAVQLITVHLLTGTSRQMIRDNQISIRFGLDSYRTAEYVTRSPSWSEECLMIVIWWGGRSFKLKLFNLDMH